MTSLPPSVTPRLLPPAQRRRRAGADPRRVLLEHQVLIASDNPWQQRARLLQSLWRERRGLLAGPRSSVDPAPLGSRLTSRDGEPGPYGLRNYMSDAARRAVLSAVADAPRTGALLSRPRLWVDLLSSQPLCFNLFGPLADDQAAAGRAFATLWPDRIGTVTHIGFEYSPGRGDPADIGDRSAFDVFVEYEGPRGPGFLGIEVRYHENLVVRAADDRGHVEFASRTGVFKPEAALRLRTSPLQHLWFDHLLALRMRAAHPGRWTNCAFVLLHPAGNRPAVRAAGDYRACLADSATYDSLTLERVVETLRRTNPGDWVDDLYDRYLNPVRFLNAGMSDLEH